jgi:hypothetical protein
MSKILSRQSTEWTCMVRKPSPAVFRSRDLDDFLKQYSPKFRRWIEDMQTVLKENMFAGEPIAKKQIPSHYIERYNVNNLFRYAHSEGYRSCYTIFCEEGIGVCSHILDLLSHEEYDRIFGYRKR